MTATALNGEFNNILNNYNGGITDANIDAAAAIAESKLLFNGSGHGHSGGADGKTITIPAATPPNGWVSIAATITYSSTDGHIFVVGTSIDLTASIGVGDRIWLSQSGNQYLIVVAISSSTMTLYGGTTYAITNSAISNPYYSHSKVPYGFNPNPIIWTETLNDTSDRAQGAPVSGTYYNLGSLSIDIPIGIWRVIYNAAVQANTTSQAALITTLSTANNSETDSAFSSLTQASASAALDYNASKEKHLSLAAKTTYYLNVKQIGSATQLNFLGATYYPTNIRAICSYL